MVQVITPSLSDAPAKMLSWGKAQKQEIKTADNKVKNSFVKNVFFFGCGKVIPLIRKASWCLLLFEITPSYAMYLKGKSI